MSSRTQAAAMRRADAITRSLATELRQLREDCGLSQRALAGLAGVSQSVISRVESSIEVPSVETCARLAAGLGADLSIRIYPNTGPPVRDRHQGRITEALALAASPRWIPIPEVGVRQPVRGWIDVVLVERAAATLVATEIESGPRRIEQVIRWSRAKADALPSAAAYPFGVAGDPAIHRLLILRDTMANRTLATLFEATLRAAYPADPWQSRAALAGEAAWPGSALLWACDRRDGAVDLMPEARHPRNARRSAR